MFFAPDYVPPSDNRLKLPTDGELLVFVPVDLIVGWSYWTIDDKKVRTKDYPAVTTGIKPDEAPKEFYFMKVLHRVSSGGKVEFIPTSLEVTQKTIKTELYDILSAQYEIGIGIAIKAAGKGLKVKYTTYPVQIEQGAVTPALIQQAKNISADLFTTDAIDTIAKLDGAPGSF